MLYSPNEKFEDTTSYADALRLRKTDNIIAKRKGTKD